MDMEEQNYFWGGLSASEWSNFQDSQDGWWHRQIH
jgi:hypothetical protein